LFAAGTITIKDTPPIESKGFLFSIDLKTSLGVTSDRRVSQTHLYPNPMHSSAFLDIPEVSSGTLTITDALGRQVRVLTDIHTSPLTIERGTLGSGIYYYTLADGIYIVGRGKIVIE
jgi:hypothetical protein